MFAKPISIILVYIMVIINLIIITLPFSAVIFSILILSKSGLAFGSISANLINGDLLYKFYKFFMLIGFLAAGLMLIYIILDMIFGFSVFFSLKNCKRYEKFKEYDFLSDIFNQVKGKFGQPRVKLYIKNSNEINAFAAGSFSSKAIVLTHGIIRHYLNNCNNSQEFSYALRSIIAHEMSHLINKDFIPGFIIMTNQKATNLLAKLIHYFFYIFVSVIKFMPYGGRLSSFIMNRIYSFVHFIITIFNRFAIYNIYRFLTLFISRSIEYRCDYQASRAFGGKKMAFALSMLGKNGYFTIFSTHPNTKSRINNVINVNVGNSIIMPRIVDSVANYFSIMILILIFLCFAEEAGLMRLIS